MFGVLMSESSEPVIGSPGGVGFSGYGAGDGRGGPVKAGGYITECLNAPERQGISINTRKSMEHLLSFSGHSPAAFFPELINPRRRPFVDPEPIIPSFESKALNLVILCISSVGESTRMTEEPLFFFVLFL